MELQKNNFINNSKLNAVENDYWGASVYELSEDGLWKIVNDINVNDYLGDKSEVENYNLPEGCETFSNDIFYNNEIVKSVIIPEGYKEIPGYAFNYCENLTSVTIPDSVTTIGQSAFYK